MNTPEGRVLSEKKAQIDRQIARLRELRVYLREIGGREAVEEFDQDMDRANAKRIEVATEELKWLQAVETYLTNKWESIKASKEKEERQRETDELNPVQLLPPPDDF